MKKHQDIRWEQRFRNYNKALQQLTKFIKKESLNELEEQGLIQAFEYTHELAWKTLKDFITAQGNLELYGSKDTTREAFQLGLIADGETWMNMIKSRNLTSHTYNEETAEAIATDIIQHYFPCFEALKDKMETLLSRPQGDIFP